MGSVTAQTLITDSLIEIGVLPENQNPSAEDNARALRILNRDIMEPWSIQRQFASGRVFTSGTFAASQSTRTIGPTGTYVLSFKPIALLSAMRIDSNNLAFPVRIRDAQWWGALNYPGFTSTYITDIYYDLNDQSNLNGTMRPWPVPSQSNTVRIETLSILTAFADLTTALDLAPGYESAVCETFKELLSRAWHKAIGKDLADAARHARAIVQIVNLAKPRRVQNDAPGTITGSTGSDPSAFKTRDF